MTRADIVRAATGRPNNSEMLNVGSQLLEILRHVHHEIHTYRMLLPVYGL